VLRCVAVRSKHHRSLLRNLRLSLAIFGKCSENVRERLSILENLRKSPENRQKRRYYYDYNKQNITCPLMEMNFIFSCSTRYLTRLLRLLVRYRVEHEKIKFISTRGHVLFSIYTIYFIVLKSELIRVK